MIVTHENNAIEILGLSNNLQQDYILSANSTEAILTRLLDYLVSTTQSSQGGIFQIISNTGKPYIDVLAESFPENKPLQEPLSSLFSKIDQVSFLSDLPEVEGPLSLSDLRLYLVDSTELENRTSLSHMYCYTVRQNQRVIAFIVLSAEQAYDSKHLLALDPLFTTASVILNARLGTKQVKQLSETPKPLVQTQDSNSPNQWYWSLDNRRKKIPTWLIDKQAWKEDQLPGSLRRFIKTYIHPDDILSALSNFRQSLYSTRSFAVKCRLLNAHEEYRWHQLKVNMDYGPSGKPCKVYGTIRDIHRAMSNQETSRQLHERPLNLQEELNNRTQALRKYLKESRAIRKQIKENSQLKLIQDLDQLPHTHVAPKEKTDFFAQERQYLTERLSDLTGVLEENILQSKALQRKLASREQLLKDAINVYQDIFVIFDAERRVKFINKEGLDFLGLTEDEVLGKRDEELLPTEITDIYLSTLKNTYLHKTEQTVEGRFFTPDGYRDVYIRYIPQLDKSGHVYEVLAITFDVTAQIGKQKEALQNKEQYQFLFRQSPMPMWIYDLQSMRFMDVNEAAVQHYGWTQEEFLSMSVYDLRHEDHAATEEGKQDKKVSNYSNSGIWTQKTKDGRLVDVEIASHEMTFNGRPARIVLANDVTERLKVEQQLFESQGNLRAIFDATSHSFFLLDSDYQIITFNTQAAQNVQQAHQRKLHVGDNMLEYADPTLIDEFKDSVKRALSGNKVSVDRKVQHLNGKRWYTVRYLPVSDDQGKIYSVAFVAEDITKNKKTEQALRGSYQNVSNFKNTLYNSALISATDLQGRIIEINDKFCEVSQYSRDELIGKPHSIINSGFHDTSFFRELWHTIQQGKIWRGDIRNRAKDGSYYWVDTYIHPIKDEEGRVDHYLSVRYLITDRKEAEQATQEYAHRLDDILENITDGFFTADREWRFTRVNKVLEQSLRRSREELIGMIVWDAFPEAAHLKFHSEYSKTMYQGEAVHFEEYFAPLDTWFEAHAYPAEDGISVYFRDITPRKKSEEEINKLSLVASRTDNTVIITNAKREIEWVNEAFTKMTGYTSNEAMGKNPGQFLQGPDTDQNTVSRIRKKLNENGSVNEEIVNYNKRGEAYWVNMDINPIFDTEGKVDKFIAIQSNISERKQSELDKARLLEELLQKNKSLEEYAFITSHNLRAPIAHILGLTALLNEDNPADPFNATIIKRLSTASQNLDSIIKDLTELLAIRKNIVKVKETVSVNKIVKKVIENLQPQINETEVSIHLNLASVEKVFTIKDFLFSILLNLLSNAIKYRHPGRTPIIQIEAGLQENQIYISITDNGLGINLDKYEEKIFNLYSRLHSHVEGKGMGLHLVKVLTEASGSTLEVKSTEGKGSTFTIFIPQEQN